MPNILYPVDLRAAFLELHRREPDIHVGLFGPTGQHAEPLWGPTMGFKSGSAEDFDCGY